VISNGQAELLRKIRCGTVSSADTINSVVASDFSGRFSRLKTSLKQLQTTIEFVGVFNSIEPGNHYGTDGLYRALLVFQGGMRADTALLQKAIKMNAALLGAYVTNFGPLQDNRLTMNYSETMSFLASNTYRIVPDFGFIALFKGFHPVAITDLVPYAGFNVNFRSVDKDIPMKDLNFKPWTYYFSFSAGLTLTSLKIAGKRDDLFGTNNLFMGFGFRVYNYLRLTAGGVLFKTINKNPLATNEPIGFSPFIGVSLDQELQSLFGGIKKLFQ